MPTPVKNMLSLIASSNVLTTSSGTEDTCILIAGRCRCEAIQLPGSSYPETPVTQIPYTPITLMFQINFGKRSIAFPPSHPYYKRLPKQQEHLIENFTRQELKRVLDNAEIFKQLKKDSNFDDVKFN